MNPAQNPDDGKIIFLTNLSNNKRNMLKSLNKRERERRREMRNYKKSGKNLKFYNTPYL